MVIPAVKKTPKMNVVVQKILVVAGVAQVARTGVHNDPHFYTFDSLRYSCQGKGDFVLLKASSGLQAHVRFRRGVASKFVSYPSAIAVNAGGDAPTVQLATALSMGNPFQLSLLIDGIPADIRSGYEDENYIVKSASGGKYNIFVKSSNVSFLIKVRGFFDSFDNNSIRTNIQVRLPPSFTTGTNTICGLLGTPDGVSSNDWVTRSCQAIEIPTTKEGLHLEGGFNYCIRHWCIQDESESLFTYSAEYPFEYFYGCDETYPGDPGMDVTTEVRELCGNDLPCLIDGAELGVQGAQNVLVSLSDLQPSSPLRAKPSQIISGVSVAVKFTIYVSSDGSNEQPDSFWVYSVDPESRSIGSDRVLSLFDDGIGVDDISGDGWYSGVLSIRSDIAGEAFGYQAVPVIDFTPYFDAATTSLRAVQSFSPASGIGNGDGTDRNSALLATINEPDISGLILVIVYQHPWAFDLDSATCWNGQCTGNACGSDPPPYTDFLDSRSAENVRVRLGDAFNEFPRRTEFNIALNAGWNGCNGALGNPASVVVYTQIQLEGTNELILGSGGSATFVIYPGCRTDCADTLVAQLEISIDSEDSSVEIGIIRK